MKTYLALALLLIAIVITGFISSPEELTVSRIATIHEQYQQANFSELVTGIDWEGEFYSEIDTWSEQVSETFYKETVFDNNGFLVTEQYGTSLNNLETITPEVTIVHDSKNFDNYSTVSFLKIKVWFDTKENREDFVTKSKEKYEKACSMIGKPVKIKRWYFIRVSAII